jgi:hypothetical protein
LSHCAVVSEVVTEFDDPVEALPIVEMMVVTEGPEVRPVEPSEEPDALVDTKTAPATAMTTMTRTPMVVLVAVAFRFDFIFHAFRRTKPQGILMSFSESHLADTDRATRHGQRVTTVGEILLIGV